MYYNTFMEKIKHASVAGSFYTNNPAELKQQIESFSRENKNIYKNSYRAVIVPHAGLVYSGRLAFEGISGLDKEIKNLFIFAPAHRVGFEGLALSTYDMWETPLGKIRVNQALNNELKENFGADFYDYAIQPEHSIEIEVPIIQYVFENVNIIPVLVGQESPDAVKKIIEHYYPDKQNGFIISSDLSHFLTDDKARQVDNYTAQMIETCNYNNFSHELACGATGIAGLMMFAKSNDYSLIRIDMTNSSYTTGDKTSVVGYGCWFLFEGEKNEFLKEYYSDFILDLCKLAIKSKFERGLKMPEYPQVFDELGASFVTLEINGRLRGCIGSIIAHKPLIEDILSNAQSAAFKDPRFNPVSQEEVGSLQIAVSLLSMPLPMEFKNEEDLLNQIKPFDDGLIIKDGDYQAVYLPSVWEELPDKKKFLNSLKMKAGLSPDYFSKTFEAYRFKTVYIK